MPPLPSAAPYPSVRRASSLSQGWRDVPGEPAAKFSAKYGQSTGVVIFDDVLVPHERVFLAGEHEEAGFLTTTYATHHRHSRIGARRLWRSVDRGRSLDATPLLSCRAFACHL
jgi:hypothetical protein